eukprot:Hpha_TRINITY_DN16538_c1_g16::TRINITY_DN16538_c1_g16_i1::g.134623::m.134623
MEGNEDGQPLVVGLTEVGDSPPPADPATDPPEGGKTTGTPHEEEPAGSPPGPSPDPGEQSGGEGGVGAPPPVEGDEGVGGVLSESATMPVELGEGVGQSPKMASEKAPEGELSEDASSKGVFCAASDLGTPRKDLNKSGGTKPRGTPTTAPSTARKPVRPAPPNKQGGTRQLRFEDDKQQQQQQQQDDSSKASPAPPQMVFLLEPRAPEHTSGDGVGARVAAKLVEGVHKASLFGITEMAAISDEFPTPPASEEPQARLLLCITTVTEEEIQANESGWLRSAVNRLAEKGPVFLLLPVTTADAKPDPTPAGTGSMGSRKSSHSQGQIKASGGGGDAGPTPWGEGLDQPPPVPLGTPPALHQIPRDRDTPPRPEPAPPVPSAPLPPPEVTLLTARMRSLVEGGNQEVCVVDIDPARPLDTVTSALRQALVMNLRRRSVMAQAQKLTPDNKDIPPSAEPSRSVFQLSGSGSEDSQLPMMRQHELRKRQAVPVDYIPGRMFYGSPRKVRADDYSQSGSDAMSGSGMWSPPRFRVQKPRPGEPKDKVGVQRGLAAVTPQRRQQMLRDEVTALCPDLDGLASPEADKLLEEAVKRYDLLSSRNRRAGARATGNVFERTGVYCPAELKPQPPQNRGGGRGRKSSFGRNVQEPPRFLYYQHYDMPFLARQALQKQMNPPTERPNPVPSLARRDDPLPLPPAPVSELLNLHGEKFKVGPDGKKKPPQERSRWDRPFAAFGALERAILAQGDHCRRTLKKTPEALSSLIKYSHDGMIDPSAAQRPPNGNRRLWMREEVECWRDFGAMGPQSVQILSLAGELSEGAVKAVEDASEKVKRGEQRPEHIVVTQGMGAGVRRLQRQEFMMGAIVDYHIKQRHTQRARLLAPLNVLPAIADQEPFSDPTQPPPPPVAGEAKEETQELDPQLELEEEEEGDESSEDWPNPDLDPVAPPEPVKPSVPTPFQYRRDPPAQRGALPTPAKQFFDNPKPAAPTARAAANVFQRGGCILEPEPSSPEAGRVCTIRVPVEAPARSGGSGAVAGLTLERQDGVVVIVGVVPGSPAAQAGIVPGTVVLSVNGESVTNDADARSLLRFASVLVGAAGGENAVVLRLVLPPPTVLQGPPVPAWRPNAHVPTPPAGTSRCRLSRHPMVPK